jgi:flagellar basal-body rod protein FlgG
VRVVGTQKVFTAGNFQTTNQDLDVAIIGDGFFGIEKPDGETAYTPTASCIAAARGCW